jgi:hypothetical protein
MQGHRFSSCEPWSCTRGAFARVTTWPNAARPRMALGANSTMPLCGPACPQQTRCVILGSAKRQLTGHPFPSHTPLPSLFWWDARHRQATSHFMSTWDTPPQHWAYDRQAAPCAGRCAKSSLHQTAWSCLGPPPSWKPPPSRSTTPLCRFTRPGRPGRPCRLGRHRHSRPGSYRATARHTISGKARSTPQARSSKKPYPPSCSKSPSKSSPSSCPAIVSGS